MAKSSKKITITEDHLSAIVREAARDGAHQALAEVGLGDETASGDIKDLRNLIDSWRDIRKTARQSFVQTITKGIIIALLVGLIATVNAKTL
jgi:hypothetical protein